MAVGGVCSSVAMGECIGGIMPGQSRVPARTRVVAATEATRCAVTWAEGHGDLGRRFRRLGLTSEAPDVRGPVQNVTATWAEVGGSKTCGDLGRRSRRPGQRSEAPRRTVSWAAGHGDLGLGRRCLDVGRGER